MNKHINFFFKKLFFTVFLITHSFSLINAQERVSVYVKYFVTNKSDISKYAKKFTEDFETELIRLDKYRVLQRRNYAQVLDERENEAFISGPTDTLGFQRDIKPEIYFGGKLIEHEDAGEYEVIISMQNLNGDIEKKANIPIEKSLIDNPKYRKNQMITLLNRLHSEETLALKEKEFRTISNKLDTYIIKVKDVHIAFRDIIEIALKREEYFNELEKIINAYNTIFTDLNDNGANYLLDFESAWGNIYGRDLEIIYKGIVEDIHKKHILKLNNVRQKILKYRLSQTKKKERKKLRDEIIWDSKDSSIGLNTAIDKVEDQIDMLYHNLKKELRTE